VLAHAQTAEQTGMVLGPLIAAALFAFWPWQAVVGAAAALFLLADVATAYWRRGNPMQLQRTAAGDRPLPAADQDRALATCCTCPACCG
jgi:MFS family permease